VLRSNWGRPVFASEAITVSTLIINIEVKNNFLKYNIFNFLTIFCLQLFVLQEKKFII
jgi:hypothetical protein